MGVVYKARDQKLERTVAIKVLAPDKAGDGDRKQRFLLEARAASALNHPNIIVIHEIAEQAGVDYIVMEYVAGRTLEQAIPPRGMRVPETLRYATQIAAALAAAHEAGITHRDLKPGNLMVTEKGVVKVLDFGLAKLYDRAVPSSDASTIKERPVTEKGTILGTVAYMSPEQAEGKAVDARSDIFSFGSVLYEMCTGRPPFGGETKMSMLSSILRDEPKPVRQTNGEVPAELERIIHRCLKKNPARRFQSTADLQIALEELREESDSGRLAAPMAAAGVAGKSRWGLWAAVVGGLAVVGVGGMWMVGRPRTEAVKSGATLTQLTFDAGLTTEPSYWAQGNLIAYASDRATEGENLDIWIQQLNGGEARRLTTNAADDRTPDIAPDGSRIVFRSERDGGGLYVVPTIGGAERKIASDGYDPKFSPDGQWIAYWTGDPVPGPFFASATRECRILLIPASGGSPKPAFAEKAAIRPFWSPDGKHLIFAWAKPQAGDWYVVPVGGGEAKRTGLWGLLAKAKLEVVGTTMRWASNAIYFNAASGDSVNTWKAGIDPAKLELSGEISRVTSSSGTESDITVAGNTMVYANTLNNDDVYVMPLDTNAGKATGEPVRLMRNVGPEYAATISHDGKRVGYASLMGGKFFIAIRDLETGVDTRVASIEGRGSASIVISPDGKRIAWSEARAPNQFEIHVGGLESTSNRLPVGGQVRSWGGDPSRLLVTRPAGAYLMDPDSGAEWKISERLPSFSGIHLSMDARCLVLYRGRKIQLLEISPNRVATEQDLIDITDGHFSDALPEISPNNRLIYFYSNRDGKQCLYARRFNPESRKPEGEPFVVRHFHSARVSPAYVGSGRRRLDTARDKIAFTMAERTGNIWKVDLGQ